MHPRDALDLAYSERDRIADLDSPGADRVSGWTVQLDRAKRRLGCTDFTRRIVTLSQPLITLNDEPVVTNTIRHEWAHVIAGASAGHRTQWLVAALTVGARPDSCADEDRVVQVPARYLSWCTRCETMLPGGRYRTSRALTQPGWFHTGRCRGQLLWIDTRHPDTVALDGSPIPTAALDALVQTAEAPPTRRQVAS